MCCLHQQTVIALYRFDMNKKLLEIFAYPRNKRAFYGLELNLYIRVLRFKLFETKSSIRWNVSTTHNTHLHFPSGCHKCMVPDKYKHASICKGLLELISLIIINDLTGFLT